MIRHIVFDVGHVLIDWDPEIPFRRLIPDAVERRWFLDHVCTSAWNRAQDRGRDWGEAEAILIRQFPEHEAMIRAYRAHWTEMLPGEIDGSFAVLRALMDAGHDVTLLTNFHQDTFPLAQDIFPDLKRPRGATVSGTERMLKPDREIYDRHVANFDLDPAACLFFDDTRANVAGAEVAGWQARHFSSADRMRRDLASFGIEID